MKQPPQPWLPIGYHGSANLRFIQQGLRSQGNQDKTVKQILATVLVAHHLSWQDTGVECAGSKVPMWRVTEAPKATMVRVSHLYGNTGAAKASTDISMLFLGINDVVLSMAVVG